MYKTQTLSERLWTSAARDFFVVVEPRTCFFASGDSKSTSFCSETNRDKNKNIYRNAAYNTNLYRLQKNKIETTNMKHLSVSSVPIQRICMCLDLCCQRKIYQSPETQNAKATICSFAFCASRR